MSAEAARRPAPLEVRPRWVIHLGLLLLLALVAWMLVALRGSDLDGDEDVLAAVALALDCWVLAIVAGSIVRNVRAGWALRLDAAGVHVPGLAVVPWSAVRSAGLRSHEARGYRFVQLVLVVAPGYSGGSRRHYERYVFGPIAGLFGERDTIAIAVQTLAIDPESLLAATRAYIDASVARAGRSAGVASPAQRVSGQSLP